jgi:phospholipase C
MDHVVLAIFENRSLDNLLGHLYEPEDGKTFEGVIAEQSDPGVGRARCEHKTVPYTVGTDMDAPNPDSGKECEE